MFDQVKQELEEIRNEQNGILRPPDVVEKARDKDTALHAHFTWNDKAAGYKWRLHEARVLIQRVKMVNPNKEDEQAAKVSTRLYHSLPSDRANGDSYRHITDVLTHEELRAQLFEQLERDIAALQTKYEAILDAADLLEAAKQQAAAEHKRLRKSKTGNQQTRASV